MEFVVSNPSNLRLGLGKVQIPFQLSLVRRSHNFKSSGVLTGYSLYPPALLPLPQRQFYGGWGDTKPRIRLGVGRGSLRVLTLGKDPGQVGNDSLRGISKVPGTPPRIRKISR